MTYYHYNFIMTHTVP